MFGKLYEFINPIWSGVKVFVDVIKSSVEMMYYIPQILNHSTLVRARGNV